MLCWLWFNFMEKYALKFNLGPVKRQLKLKIDLSLFHFSIFMFFFYLCSQFPLRVNLCISPNLVNRPTEESRTALRVLNHKETITEMKSSKHFWKSTFLSWLLLDKMRVLRKIPSLDYAALHWTLWGTRHYIYCWIQNFGNTWIKSIDNRIKHLKS